MRIGSLFSGAGGLDMAVEAVFGGEVIWQSEMDKAASKVLAYRFPGVPNLGDITTVDLNAFDPVDVLCGGFPCQDVSAAGKRAGIKDGTRSGLWSVFAEVIDNLRPRFVVIENVRGLLSARAHRNLESSNAALGDGADGPVLRAAGAVLGDLADLGYDAQWTTVAAASVGAPHRRERVFIVAADAERRGGAWGPQSRGDSAADSQGRQAVLAGGRGRATSHTSGAAVGMLTGGSPTQETRTNFGDRSGDCRGERADVELLPTPSACNANDGEGTETWLARREVVKARVKNGNGMGMPLAIAVQLLPTPTTQDGANNGGPSQFERNTLPLNTEVLLLPTPNAQDGNGGKAPRGGRNTYNTGTKRQVPLTDLPDLLCTPSASDGAGGKTSRSGGRIDEPLLGGQVREMETSWGKYAAAIHRWEQIAGPAPAPTEPNRNNKPRLNPAFSEWMMGWPAGWVTDSDIGISRNDQLRIIGNGVCPQQAVAALQFLLSVSEVAR